MTSSARNNKPTPERNEELIAVAARLFRDRGYDGTSIRDIASAMGIGKSSLYHYVATKEDLLWMIVEAPLTGLVETVAAVFADTTIPLAERIRLASEAHCESFERYHPHMFVITRENGETLSTPRRTDLVALRDRYYLLWKQAIVAGRRSGEIRSDLDVGVAVQAILGMINWMFRWFSPGGKVTARAVADQFADLLVAGVSGAPRPASHTG
jgi:TetR/AcrR family transcriptional regulator, cholesterol catabolism regulator